MNARSANKLCDPCDVVIVVPPLDSASSPAFGPSLLVAGCRQRGIKAKVLYGSIALAARVGLQCYDQLSRSFNAVLAGESLFRALAFADHYRAEDGAAFVAEQAKRSLQHADGLDQGDRDAPISLPTSGAVTTLVDEVEPFVSALVATILAHQPRIVGFSTVFQQTLASIAIAGQLKAQRPEIVTVIGGPNLASPMAEALAEVTDVFDHLFVGEADFAFPAFCAELIAGSQAPPTQVIHCALPEALDQVPVPDYDDYFAQLSVLAEADQRGLPAWLYTETSRGCWWGERRQCSFCGLNGSELRHRHKSAERVLGELGQLAEKYGVRRFQVTDNVLPRAYFRDQLVPALVAAGQGYQLYAEVRPDLKASELDLFFLAGLQNLQPGIESLASNVLGHLNKGTSGVGNLRFLRNCTCRGISVSWNLLLAVPGETRADYEGLIRLMPKIGHLQPPQNMAPIRIDRFSPYHQRCEDFGLANLRPAPNCTGLFPPGSPLTDLANHFLADYSTELLDDPDLMSRLAAAARDWSDGWTKQEQPPRLTAVALGEGLELINDTRPIACEEFFVADEALIELLNRFERPIRIATASAADPELLAELLRRHLVVEHEGFYLSVVTRPAIAARLRQELTAP